MKKTLNYIKTLLILGCTLVLGALVAHAQGVTTASVSGMIVDQNGTPVNGARIVALHEPSGTTYTASSRSNGYYNIPNMRIGGPYKVTVTTPNAETEIKKGISLTLGEDQDVSFKVQTNETNKDLDEVVVSSTTSSVLNAKRTGAASTLSNKAINDIATSTRSFTDLTKLDPRANGLSFGGRNPLYNNITVDGAYFNNAFGLQATIGSQASASPISLDAIEQVQIAIAPYDVRQGMSTGANINAVTRSGDNQFRGSVYGFFQNDGLVGDRVSQFVSPIPKFDQTQFGARFGGPILKNKIFFFVSYEQEKRIAPPNPYFVASSSGVTGINVSAAQRDTLQKLRDTLKLAYGYDPGPFEGYNLERFNRKINARLDFNISQKHTLNIKFNYLESYSDILPSSSASYPGGRSPSKTGLPFQGSLYRINNNLYSAIAELNSKLSNKVNNSLSVGYTVMKDFRESPFNPSNKILPTVDIANGVNSTYTVFGYEPFSYENKLNSNILQIQDNLTFYVGSHTLTAGVAAEFNSFENGFAPNYQGQYKFKSLTDFYNSSRTGVSNAETYQLRYSLLKDTTAFPIATMSGNTYSAYVQDEWNILRNLRVTVGLRVDMFHFPQAASYNPIASGLTFNDGMKHNTSEFPGFTPLFSPRIGFNWDALKNKKIQVRGGVGIFTGRIPFVWLSNQVSNTGSLFGSFTQTNPTNRPFNADINAYRPVGRGGDTANSYNLVFTDPNFEFPQVLRANLAVDVNLGKGWVVTGEGIFTKDINAVYFTNIAMADPTGTLGALTDPDKRYVWYGTSSSGVRTTSVISDRKFTDNTKTSPTISDAILMKNTDLGYSLVLTAQIQKQFSNGLLLNASYTYTNAKSVNDGGSVAQSMWRDRVISNNPNDNVLANTINLQPHRVTAFAAYEFSYSKILKTTLSLYYSVATAFAYSYTYAGDINGDRERTNDLIYVPRNQSEINLVDIGTYDKNQQWQDLNTYIENDDYLRTRRGQYAERNGAFAPALHQLDFRFMEEIKLNIGNTTNRLQLTLDIFNFLNLLNPRWGIIPTTNRTGLITFKGFNASSGAPEYTYPYLNPNTKEPLTQAFSDNTAVGSRWSIQLGVRYIFN